MSDGRLTTIPLFCVGITQLINWGLTFYLPGALGSAITTQTGWPPAVAFSGLTIALLSMGLISPLTGRLLARFGPRNMMATGTLIIVMGCGVMACIDSVLAWYALWGLMGIGMRLALYDAAFALLVAIEGVDARRPISRVTLLGGLASAVFWWLGTQLLQVTDWRHVVVIYGATGMISLLCLLAIPVGAGHKEAIPDDARPGASGSRYGNGISNGRHCDRRDASLGREKFPAAAHLINGFLYAALIAMLSFVSTGISTHIPEIVANYRLPIITSMLWGVGQVGARLLEVLSGNRLSAVGMNLVIGLLLPLCFFMALAGDFPLLTISAFVFCYGAVNGLATLVKAALPLVLFERQQYAQKMGTLLAPAFFLSALAPSVYALFLTRYGTPGTLLISAMLALVVTLLSVLLWFRCRRI